MWNMISYLLISNYYTSLDLYFLWKKIKSCIIWRKKQMKIINNFKNLLFTKIKNLRSFIKNSNKCLKKKTNNFCSNIPKFTKNIISKPVRSVYQMYLIFSWMNSEKSMILFKKISFAKFIKISTIHSTHFKKLDMTLTVFSAKHKKSRLRSLRKQSRLKKNLKMKSEGTKKILQL